MQFRKTFDEVGESTLQLEVSNQVGQLYLSAPVYVHDVIEGVCVGTERILKFFPVVLHSF